MDLKHLRDIAEKAQNCKGSRRERWGALDAFDDAFDGPAVLSLLDEITQLRARVQELEAETGWRCFWCDAVFADRAAAEIHFGAAHSERPAPECLRIERRARKDAEIRVKNLEGILGALVLLKDHKESVGKDEYYEKAKADMWARARKALETEADHER